MNVVSQNEFAVQLNGETYALFDLRAGLVSLHEGQKLDLDSDWGGKRIAALSLVELATLSQAARFIGETHAMPVDFAYGLAEVAVNGIRYTAPFDFDALESDTIGD